MRDSVPAPYSPTSYGRHDGEAVVQTPHTVKTLQGEATELLLTLLSEMDGETAASDLVDRVTGASPEHVELLYENALAYDARAIPAALAAAGHGHVLEPLLPAIAPANHQSVPERLDACAVAVFGHRERISPVIARLRGAGVTVTDGVDGDPDVVLLSELLERDTAWSAANEAWLDSAATLVRTRLTTTGWRLGPVFTPDAPACLNCLYQRVDANGAGGRLFTETVGGDPAHAGAYGDTVTGLLFGTLLGQVPRYMDDQFVVYDHYDQDVRTPRVFALPHCEVCAGV
jgi:hypothetical protein